MVQWRQITHVFLPFAVGYFLTYVFRTINAVISQRLMSDLALDVADIGLLTSVFFVSFAAAQLPLGVCLDRFGPRRVQIALLPVAAIGALLFSVADGFIALILGRILIGIGVASALMAGLKAIILWFPRERLSLLNGCFVTIGALGAVSATTPAEFALASIGWRGLFGLLATLAIASALLIYLVVPESPHTSAAAQATPFANLTSVYADSRFWRLAPLSAICVGTSWSLQGLWGALWLSDVESLEQSDIVQHLFVMAVAVCGSALLLGVGADRLRRHVSPKTLLAVIALVFIAAQLSLALRWPLPLDLLWTIIAGVGASTVLSFAILAEEFPREIAGQANAALNIIHVTGAFLMQYATGVIIHQWPSQEGHYPLSAYQVAFEISVVLQIASLAWYMRPERTVRVSRVDDSKTRRLEAEQGWSEQLAFARASVWKWRLTTAAAAVLSGFLGVLVVTTSGDARVNPYAADVGRSNSQYRSNPNAIRNTPSDALVSYLLERFVINVRSLSTDSIVVHMRWLEAYDLATDRTAETLSEDIRTRKPFANIGARPVIAEVSSVRRVFGNTFETRWKELAYEQNKVAMVRYFIARCDIALEPITIGKMQSNPFGVRIDTFLVLRDVRDRR